MKLLVFFILCFALFTFMNYFVFKKEKYKNIILILFVFIINSYFVVSSSYYHVSPNGVVEYIIVNSVFISLGIGLLSVVNSKTFIPGKELILFVPLFLQAVFQPFLLTIYNYATFYSLIFVYISIYIIILFYRSLKMIDLKSILKYINYIALYNGLLGILQYLTGKKLLLGSFNDSIIYTEGVVEAKRAVGLIGASNGAGTIGALLLCVSLYNLSLKRSALNLLTLLITMVFLILTFTRIGYVAAIVSFIIIYMAYKPKKKKIVYLKIVSFCSGIPLLGFLLYTFSSEIITKLFTQRGDTSSQRFIQYEKVFEYVLSDNWLIGVGIGQYRDYLMANFRVSDITIHSQYLNIFTEQGIAIFILFLLFNFSLFFSIVKSSKIDRNIKLLTITLFVSNLICSNFNPNQYYYLNNVLYYLIIIGIYFHIKKTSKETGD